jgi:hypothetical protein
MQRQLISVLVLAEKSHPPGFQSLGVCHTCAVYPESDPDPFERRGARICESVPRQLQQEAAQSVAESAEEAIWLFSPRVVEFGGEASRPAKVATLRAFKVPWGHTCDK